MPASSWRRLAPVLALATLNLAGSAPAHAGGITHGFADDHFEYALYDPGTDHGSTFVTSTTSWERVQTLFEGEKDPVFWFALDGRSYLVRDAATVAEATRILGPVRELGKKQGKLGARQGALGARQGKLGGQQGRLGARQGLLGARIAGLVARSTRSGKAATREERRRLEEEMEELGRQQELLGRQQQPLGEEQQILGAQQAELGRRQVSASKRAGSELRRLAERARGDGRARRLD